MDKEANPIEEARAGDIIALVSMADTDTGDTLCDSNNPVVPERLRRRLQRDDLRNRGQTQEQLERGTNIAVVATVPLSEMFGYIGNLRAMSSGRASYTMEFSHYDPVPKNVADTVIADANKAKAAPVNMGTRAGSASIHLRWLTLRQARITSTGRA